MRFLTFLAALAVGVPAAFLLGQMAGWLVGGVILAFPVLWLWHWLRRNRRASIRA